MNGHRRLSHALLLRDFLCHDLGFDLESARERCGRAEIDSGAASAASSAEFVEAAVKAASGSRQRERVRMCGERALDACRMAGFAPRYFQFLALLLADHCWGRVADDDATFLAEFEGFHDAWSERRGAGLRVGKPDVTNLQVSAFWLATGAGKTHLLHASLALLGDRNWDRILLITPNETLSRQHADRLRRARIAPVLCYPDDGDASVIGDASADTVVILDLAKLRFEKTGEGVTLDARDFSGGRNLVFVDEGHKGQKKEASTWKAIQRHLAGVGAEQPAHRGQLIEFSATFGQVVDSEGSFELYARSIIFDYPYDRFHADGYGKDFHVANAQSVAVSGEDAHDQVLTAALLAFALQRSCYVDPSARADWVQRGLSVEPPLWLLLGARVIGKKKPTADDELQLSDVIRVLGFLQRILASDGIEWLAARFMELDQRAGLQAEHIAWRDSIATPKLFAARVRELVFGDASRGRLVARRFREAPKELGLGLEVAGQVRYFGVVNVGEVAPLASRLAESGWPIEEDNLRGSLFQRMNDGDADLTVLIGSRMFAEGWDSYRAASLTLLQLGANEGPLVIQMFGRVIRFAGSRGDMKRLPQPSVVLRPLQTAYVFGLRAAYLSRFLQGLKDNGLSSEVEEIEVKVMDESVRANLVLPVVAELPLSAFRVDARGAEWLGKVRDVKVDFDIGVQLTDGDFRAVVESIGDELTTRFQELVALLDEDRVLERLCAFRRRKGWWNLRLDRAAVRAALASDAYELRGPADLLRLDGGEKDLRRLEDIAVTVLERMLQKAHSAASSDFDQWAPHPIRAGEAFPAKLQRFRVQT